MPKYTLQTYWEVFGAMFVLSGQRRPGFIIDVPNIRALKQGMLFAAAVIVLGTILWGGYFMYSSLHRFATAGTSQPSTVGTPRVTASSASHSTSTPKPQPPRTTALAAAPVQPAPSQITEECAPDHSYTPAGPLPLTTLEPGLHEVIETPHYYRVYGNTVAQIGQQIASCAPTARGGDSAFSGETDYWLGWQFDYALSGNQCVVTQTTVGLHITQVYPQWQSTSDTPDSVTASWQSFITGLNVHEQGHVALGHTYAQAIVSDLQTMSAPTCVDLLQAANSAANHAASALITANDQYDSTTNHGATQGAALY